MFLLVPNVARMLPEGSDLTKAYLQCSRQPTGRGEKNLSNARSSLKTSDFDKAVGDVDAAINTFSSPSDPTLKSPGPEQTHPNACQDDQNGGAPDIDERRRARRHQFAAEQIANATNSETETIIKPTLLLL